MVPRLTSTGLTGLEPAYLDRNNNRASYLDQTLSLMRGLPRITPPPIPDRQQCIFYHCLDFPDGDCVLGQWDIRGRFEQYVAHYPLADKTVLDVGAATGFLTFSAEAAGAAVTALDCRDAADFERIPFVGNLYHIDRVTWDREQNKKLAGFKNGFWYAWHKFNSRATVSYTPIRELQYFDETFDIVIAGAIIEHLADPISTIGAMCYMANEAVIIAFTPVAQDAKPYMIPMNTWIDPEQDYTWWLLSEGLLDLTFANLGFAVELHAARALSRTAEIREHERCTIVARRIAARDEKPLTLATTDPALGNAAISALKRLRRFFV
jgi:2-polyprenyl-3-methyl-5-hydroxy-6-metoxy-1,4-benzoquinol methylase